MSPLARRAFIALDEWLGIALLAWLRAQHDPLFWHVLGVWVFATYFVAYPSHWLASRRGR